MTGILGIPYYIEEDIVKGRFPHGERRDCNPLQIKCPGNEWQGFPSVICSERDLTILLTEDTDAIYLDRTRLPDTFAVITSFSRFAFNAEGVSSATILPWLIIPTRSQNWSASSM